MSLGFKRLSTWTIFPVSLSLKKKSPRHRHWPRFIKFGIVMPPAAVTLYRSFATRVSQLKICHFGVTGIERNVRRCTFNRHSVITQFAKLAAGEQLCRRCTHRKLQHFKTFKILSWKMIHFELWQCCRKWAICDNKREYYHTSKLKSKTVLRSRKYKILCVARCF